VVKAIFYREKKSKALMSAVLRVDEQLASFSAPPLHPLDPLQLPRIECLVICAGFEDRATALLTELLSAGVTPSVTVLIEYEPYIPQNRTAEIRDVLSQAGATVIPVKYARSDRANAGYDIANIIQARGRPALIDVSGMSRLLIVQVLTALGASQNGFQDISLCYAEAMEYPPAQDQVDRELEKGKEEFSRAQMFISSGVYDLAIVPELSSPALLGQPLRSIVFPSFNPYQLAALSSEIQPTRFSILHGIPPDPENRWRTRFIAALNQIGAIRDKEEHEVSTLDYRETLTVLAEIYQKNGHLERLVLSPTGSKMQTVAVGLFRAFMSDIQIVYPTPLSYAAPDQVTVGVRTRHLLDLGPFQVFC